MGWLFRKNLKSRTFWRILRRLKDLYKVSGMLVIPTRIPISKVVRKPGLVVRKIEKVGRKSSNCRRFFRGTFHARGHFPGRSCDFSGDLPRWRPFSRKVLRFFGGPSMLEAIFPEGPAFFRGTFHARGHFPGRSCLFPGDLPSVPV